MSDELTSLLITVGLLAALALWVPALDLLHRLCGKNGRDKKTKPSNAGLNHKPRRSPAI